MDADSLIVITMIMADGERKPFAVTNSEAYAKEVKAAYPERKPQARQMNYYKAFDMALSNPDTIITKLV